MMPINAADRHHNSFIEQLLLLTQKKNLAIIGMKVLGRGAIFKSPGIKDAKEAIRYTLSLPVSTVIIGCSSPKEVEENVRIAKDFKPLSQEEMRRLESLTKGYFGDVNYFKVL